MKKTLTLAIALVLALSLAAPALAFFGEAPGATSTSGVKVDIYLGDHDWQGGLLSGLLEKPAADRGYAKNEIVAAVASLTVPKGVQIGVPGFTTLFDPSYQAFILGGDHVNVNVAENNIDAMNNAALVNTFPGSPAAIFSDADNSLSIPVAGMTQTGTFRALYFAKVIGGDAVMRATLSKNLQLDPMIPIMPLGDAGYFVFNLMGNEYIIVDGSSSTLLPLFIIGTNATTNVAESIQVAANWNMFGVTYQNGEYTYMLTGPMGMGSPDAGRIPTDEEKRILDDLMNRVFAETLGLDITKHGYVMDDDVWSAYANSLSDLTAEVEIKPWTPYVAAPGAASGS